METQSRQEYTRALNLRFTFGDDLQLEYTLIGVVVHLSKNAIYGEPGSPAVPGMSVRVALPPNTLIEDLKTAKSESSLITTELLPIAPVQPPRAGITDTPNQEDVPSYHRPQETQYNRERRETDPRREQKPDFPRFPVPEYVPPNPDLYAQATRQPAARLISTTSEGRNPVVTLRLNPVQLLPDGHLEFSRVIELDIILRPDPDSKPSERPEHIVSRAQAQRQIALTRLTVANRDAVIDYSDLYPILNLGTDYLIITDNQYWDAATITPIGTVGGDLVAAFERLAAWKRQRGLKVRVVTISEIVSNRYGNFRANSYDLQEVIRKFLKRAYRDWGVAWVLIGGDTNIVPIRRVASGLMGGVSPQTTNPPPENTSFWTGSYLRIHATNLGVWWGASINNLLVNQDDGTLIPYDAAGTSDATHPGWYLTTNDNYNVRSTMPTEFVRVNGPDIDVNAPLQFLYEWNTIPSDLYYSSFPAFDYPASWYHDWDANGNGVFGQYLSANLDLIQFTPSVSLGRASVRSVAQADAFVNKVIAYEKFQRPDGTALDLNWTTKVVLVSENWGGRLWTSSTTDNPPTDNTFHHTAGEDHALLKLAETPDWNWSLLAYHSETNVTLIPYRLNAAALGSGWHFAVSDSNLSPSLISIPTGGGGFFFLPLPTQWVVIYGSPADLEPTYYIWNHTDLDGSLDDQETLRMQLAADTGFNSFKRLYEDIQDMTPSQVAAAPLELISTDGLRNALNAGPHIVSLSGHGNSGGCCKLDPWMSDNLTNGYHTFIAYADSCLTNQLDGDAVSEHLIGNPNGGAVAYIGNTRFSWIGDGDDYQRRFFQEWATLGGDAHLGLLNDTRAMVFDESNAYFRWERLALNLVGDPEMPLWWRPPLKIVPPHVVWFDKLKLIFTLPDPPPDYIDLPYRSNWGLTYAHLRQGEHEELVLANAQGIAELPLNKFKNGSATLTLTRPGHAPLVQELTLGGEPPRKVRKSRFRLALIAIVGALLAAQLVQNLLERDNKE